MNPKSYSIAMLLASALLAGAHPAHAKKLYRWVDEQGNITFSDQVPPDQVQHKRETLSKKGSVLDILERAKTPEERAKQKRLAELRQEQEKIIAKQAAADKVLLATYRSLDDMERALENKLALMDGKQRVIDGNLQRLKQQLHQQQTQAANQERNAQTVPEKLLQDINATRQQIDSAQHELLRHQLDRQRLENEFRRDMARFEFLTQNNSSDESFQTSLTDSSSITEIGLFICRDSEQCQKAWQYTIEFVYRNATTGRDVETDKLIMTALPTEDSDYSLSASKLMQNGSEQIFLDIRCKASTVGKETCAGAKAQAIRRDFSAYIQSRLAGE